MGKFIKGQSGNQAGSSKKVRARSVIASSDPSPDASPDPRSLHERAVGRLTAIMDDPDAEVGHQLMAIRLLIGEDLASTIRSMEHDHDEDARRQERIQTAVGLVLGHHPEVGPDQAERYVCHCLDLMAPQTLTEVLKDRLGFWKSKPLTDETLGQIWVELGLPGNPGPESEPPAKCGFKELPTPDPDREYLQAQAVERERQRREKLKHPAAVPSPPTPFRGPEVEAEPTEPPVMPAHLDSRIISFGDLAIFPGLGE